MPHMILSEVTASVLELKRNPMGTVAAGKGSPVAILNRSEPSKPIRIGLKISS